MEKPQRPELSNRPRKNTTIASTIVHPGTIRINVQGAFIVDEEAGSPPKAVKQSGTRDIRLPHHSAEVSHIAVDIGGSLAKLVYFTRDPSNEGGRLNFTNFETDNIDDCIAYMGILINGQRIANNEAAIRDEIDAGYTSDTDTITTETERERRKQKTAASNSNLCVMATGGGAHKYYDKIRAALDGVHVYREDEMECLIVGLDFFITEIPEEVFTYSDEDPMRFAERKDEIYPYLLVNIGSGVSMIKVSGPQRFERIGGTSLGGGTLWGLLSLITGATSFDQMLKLADGGDNTAVDMLVGDIYGTDYGRIGLKSTTIASTFGKVFKKNATARKAREEEQEAERGRTGRSMEVANDVGDGIAVADVDAIAEEEDERYRDEGVVVEEGEEVDERQQTKQLNDDVERNRPSTTVNEALHENMKSFKAEDISRSLLYAISNNIGQISYLQAQQHNLEHIYFGGSFIRGHKQTMNTLAYAIKFWSKGEKQAYFLRHEGYLGAVGAFLRRQPRDWGRRRSSFG